MIQCTSVYNLLTQTELKCASDSTINVNKLDFLQNIVKLQQKYVVYVYSFSDFTSYCVVNEDPAPIIEEIDSVESLDFLKKICALKTKNERVISIIDSFKKLTTAHNIHLNNFSDQELQSKLEKVPSMYDSTRVEQVQTELNTKLESNQKGGFLLYYLEESLDMPMLTSTLEFIDWILIVLSTVIPSPSPPGLVLDAISIVWAFLRFQPMMMLGSAVSFVPAVGDILGGVIKVLSKIFKYTSRFFGKRKRN